MSDVINRIEKMISNCDHIRDEYLVSLLADAADEIERLRGENQTIIDKAFEQAEMDRKRIEELESVISKSIMHQKELDRQHHITTDQIRAAWKRSDFQYTNGYDVLEELGIVRCEGCEGGALKAWDKGCPACNDEGWRRRG